MPFTLSRQQFYDVLWAAPMKQLRPVFGISDVMIGRTARSGQIPLPGRGYWRKLETGQSVVRDDLDPPHLLTTTQFSFKGELTPEVSAMFTGAPGEGGAEEAISVLADRLRKRLGKFKFTKLEREFHPDIKKMADRDLRGGGWNGPKYTSQAGRRALMVANALFLKVEELGCRPYTQTDWDEFKFSLGMTFVGLLKIRIDTDGKSLSLGPADVRQSEGLGIRTFRDTKTAGIEERLAEILVEYAEQGETTRRRWRDEDAERQRLAEEQRVQDEARRRREAELAEARRLKAERQAQISAAREEVSAWKDAIALREYAQALQDAGGSMERVTQLRDIADGIDPFPKKELP